jgi:predicted alpha/beta-fold hydrolase
MLNCLKKKIKKKTLLLSSQRIDRCTQVVRYVKNVRGANSRVFAIGFSAGSGSVTKYVSEKGADCLLSGAVSIANGYSITRGMAWVHNKRWMLERCLFLAL